MSKTGTTVTFKYNSEGLRVQKTVNGTVTNYTLHGKNIVHMTQGSNTLHFWYDAQNRPAIVQFNGTKYAYIHNLQGDIVGLIDSTGAEVVKYTYDAWGKPLSTTGSLASTLGTVQPFRYRGYVYDVEIGLYYLRSRYYNPIWGRFLNVDKLIKANLFSYCENTPINQIDRNGNSSISITNPGMISKLDTVADEVGEGGGGAAFSYIVNIQILTLPFLGLFEALFDAIFTKSEDDASAQTKEREREREQNRNQAYFTNDPYDFRPNGLIMKELPGSYNGRIIKWRDVTGTMIFEWDEDLMYGEHYHVKVHDGQHYHAGDPVPEPFNTDYFGGNYDE